MIRKLNINSIFSKYANRIFIGLLVVFLSGFFVTTTNATDTTGMLISPNGGENLSGIQTITWKTTSCIVGDTVTLILGYNGFPVSLVSPGTSNTIISGLTCGDGSYSAWDTDNSSIGDRSDFVIGIERYDSNGTKQGTDYSDSYFTIDNTAPTFTVGNGTETGPVQTDTINAIVDASISGLASTRYGFSSDATCDGNDDWTSPETGIFNSGEDFTIEGDHTDFLCVRATDEAGNVGYKEVGQLNTDNTEPTVISIIGITIQGVDDTIVITFSESVSPSTDWATAIDNIDSPSGTTVDLTDATYSYNSNTHTLAITLDETNAYLKNGYYVEVDFNNTDISDYAGNNLSLSPSPVISGDTITGDIVQPNVAITYDNNGPVKDGDSVNVTATFDEALETSIPKISIDFDSAVTNTVMTSTSNPLVWTYNWTVTVGGDGTATITIDAEDLAGNNNPVESNNTIVVDNTAPSFSSYTFDGVAENTFFNPGTVLLEMTASEPLRWLSVQFQKVGDSNIFKTYLISESFDSTNTATQVWNGLLTGDEGTTPPAPEGTYEVEVHVKDLAGNDTKEVLSPYTVTIDTINPIMTISAPTNNLVVHNTSGNVDFTFTATDTNLDTCAYKVDEGTYIDLTNCNSTQTLTLLDGRQTVTLKATDKAGNTETDSVNFVVDTDRILTVDNSTGATADFTIIQGAIDSLVTGITTISVAGGTYTEDLTINKEITIIGESDSIIVGKHTVSKSDITLDNLNFRLNNASGNILTLSSINNFKILRSEFHGTELDNQQAILVGKNILVNGFIVKDSSFEDFMIAWYFQKDTAVNQVSDNVINVEVENVIFENNDMKGIYLEKLSNAHFKNIIVRNNGNAGKIGHGLGYQHSAGIDINLKAGVYSDIVFENMEVYDNGLASQYGAGVLIKARDDGSYASNPAFLNSVIIDGGVFEGNERGLRFGEQGQNNASPYFMEVKNVKFLGETINYTGANPSFYGSLINNIQVVVNAKYSYWGDVTGPQHPIKNPAGLGGVVSDYVDFSPFYNSDIMAILVSVDPIASFILTFDPTSAIVNTNSNLTVTAKDVDGYTVVNDTTTQLTLIGDNGVSFGSNLLTMGALGNVITTITNTILGLVNVTATETFGPATGTGQITFIAGGDVTAPVISNIQTTSIGTDTVTITWTTNEGSTSQVEYGVTSSYGTLTVANSNLVTNHTVVIAGLIEGTDYHFRVISIDAFNNSSTSGDNVFATTGVDNTPPVITLLGVNPQTLTVGDDYSELGATANDNIDGDISENILIDSSAVNTSIAGTYIVTYNVSDKTGNGATPETRTVIVVDPAITPITPTITLNGEAILSAYTVTEANVRFNSGLQFDTTDAESVTVNGSSVSVGATITAVDQAKAITLGVHSYSVIVTSSTGDTSHIMVSYQVNADPIKDTVKPVIDLLGANPQTVIKGNSYTEFGAVASDIVDGDIASSNIVIDSSEVDTSVAGTYEVTYDVSDIEGNDAVTRTRTVIVVDPAVTPVIPTVVLNGGAYSNSYTVSEAETRFADGLEFDTTNTASFTINGDTVSMATPIVTAKTKAKATAIGIHVYNVVVTSSTGDTANVTVSYEVIADFDDTASLEVTGVGSVKTYAIPDDTFENGWSWVFRVTVPTNETQFKMKFSDFISGANSITSADNVRFYTAQSSDSFASTTATMITTTDTYSNVITLNDDLDSGVAGRQIDVIVEMKVPVGSAGGSYSASYGVDSGILEEE